MKKTLILKECLKSHSLTLWDMTKNRDIKHLSFHSDNFLVIALKMGTSYKIAILGQFVGVIAVVLQQAYALEGHIYSLHTRLSNLELGQDLAPLNSVEKLY